MSACIGQTDSVVVGLTFTSVVHKVLAINKCIARIVVLYNKIVNQCYTAVKKRIQGLLPCTPKYL
ncbi:MAG: hypothetical protein ACI4II_00455 [Acutalibacteraceae bacterium]